MVDLMHCLTNSLFFDTPLLYYYTNLNSSIICFLFSGDMYLSFGDFDSSLSLLFLDFLETLVILSSIYLPIKSLVASAVFWTALFEAVFIASVVDFLALSRSFLLYLLLNCVFMFLAKDKNPYPLTYIISGLN